MKEVTIDNVRERIAELEMVHGHGELSLRGEFELACLRQFVAVMEQKPYGYAELYDFPRTTATLYPEQDRYATMPLYAAPPAPVSVPDADPSLNAMMRALDAFYADDNVPERAMLSAFRILLADVREKPAPVVTDDRLLENLETRIKSLEIGERKGALSTHQEISLKAYRLAVQCLRSSAISDETDNTAQQFEALATSAWSGKP